MSPCVSVCPCVSPCVSVLIRVSCECLCSVFVRVRVYVPREMKHTLAMQSQGVPDSPCHTVKVVEGDNGVKVHAKDLPQLGHQGRVVGGEDCHVVSRLIPEEEEEYACTTRAGRLDLEFVMGDALPKVNRQGLKLIPNAIP